jgi:hypothetical protein
MLNRNRSNPDMNPPILGLFEKRIDGDDSLLALARLRFKEAGLGTEFYAETPEELDKLLQFKPTPETPAVVHLGRGLNLFLDESHAMVIDFAERFKNQVFGFVIHDQVEIKGSFDDYLKTLRKLGQRLEHVNSPCVYIEYAAGLPLDLFLSLFEAMGDIPGIGCGVDIGHVGLWQTRATYAAGHPGKDVCVLSSADPQLPEVIEDIQKAVASAINAVIHVVQVLEKTARPVHFHLHDGHPLSTLSFLGISDHLSFLEKIDIPFDFKGRKHLDPMYGPKGLERIVVEAMRRLGRERVSFSLEIHPTKGWRPLGKHAHLFSHWKDKTNAEKMNYWLSVLLENHQLVKKALGNQTLNQDLKKDYDAAFSQSPQRH